MEPSMDSYEQLEKARSLIDQGDPEAALKLLGPLYNSQDPDQEVMLEIVSAFEHLEELGKARAMLGKALKQFPHNSELWLRLSSLYQAEDDYQKALESVDIALVRCGEEISLMLEKAQLLASLGKSEEMHALIEEMILNHPEQRVDLLVDRASLYELLSYEPSDDDAQVKNALGLSLGVVPLRNAIKDLDQVLSDSEPDWRIVMKRAKLKKDLQEFDAAIVDYDLALEMLDEEDASAREFIEQERDGCLNDGQNERNRLANILREGKIDIDDVGQLSQDEMITNNLIDAMAERFAEGEDIVDLVEEIDDDPDQMTALTIAQDILKNAREPSADFVPAKAADFARSAQKYCDKAEKTLTANGFETLGDFEPRGLSQQIGSRVLLRIFVSEDQRTCAAAFEIKPLKPNFLLWLLMIVLGKWKKFRMVELESETADGRFLITNNSGDVNPFSAGDEVDLINLPSKTSIEETIASHLDRIEQCPEDFITRIGSLDEAFELQERLRLAKNAYRERIGFVTDDELKKLLGKHHDRYASDVKKYLTRLGSAAVSAS
jgi:tetratricopeptide (TPR) repeat protein